MEINSKKISILIAVSLFLVITACQPTPPTRPASEAERPSSAPTLSTQSNYIDTHMHLDGVYRSSGQVTADYATAADNLIALMDQFDVAQAFLMELPEVRAADLQPALQKYPQRLFWMGGGSDLNPLLQDTPPTAVTPAIQTQFEQLAEQVLADGAVGFGEMLSLHLCMTPNHSYQVAAPDHPLFLSLADIAARHNVPIDLHMEAVPATMNTPANLLRACDKNPATLPATIPPFEELLAHNRDANIVWQHVGWDNIGYMTPVLVQTLLEKHPNLYIALRVEARPFVVGGSDPMSNRLVDSSGQLEAEWLAVITAFPDRFMIGGDEFVGIPGLTPDKPASFAETWAILNQLPPDLAAKVGGENAARIYRLHE